MTDADKMVENVDCITIGGQVLTHSGVLGTIDIMRNRYFDLQIEARPIVSESSRVLRPESLTPEQKEYLDSAPYDFDNSSNERRFRTEFDYYAALIRASEDNADQLSALKRRATKAYHEIEARYGEVYAMCMDKYGSKAMGSNQAERHAWFRVKYPALSSIRDTYSNFLEEIDIELERWQQFAAAASRGLTAIEMSYKATGRLGNIRSGKYDA